jgi:maleylacetate reductase
VDPHGLQPVTEAGEPLGRAPVLILVHGRNAAPANILDLLPRLARSGFTCLAPAAAGRTWYPQSFMADVAMNEPYLTSALSMLESLVARVEAAGVPRSRIVMLGFSQGACLTAEFAVRHASRFGGFILLTGGLIGPPGTSWHRPGTFNGTPIFLGSGDPDHHVPVSRVLETAEIFGRMGAAVTTRIYPGRAHTVSDDEIIVAQAILDELTRVTVLSGPGSTAQLPGELDARSLQRVLIVTTARGASEASQLGVTAALGRRVVGVCAKAAPQVPVIQVAAALADVDQLNSDALLAFGGGSAIGLAKAIALERPLPIIAMPTTYSGSEMTSVWGITEGSRKRTGRNPRVAPGLVVYDPTLTLSLPPHVSAASGMNAIAHAVEALYATDASPIAAAAAEQALVSLSRALPRIVADPASLEMRSLAMRGAHLAGVALQHSSMGLHHKICHVLGGSFGLPHAETHAALLPHVVAFNALAAPEAMEQIARALGVSDAAEGLRALDTTLGLTMSLRELGLGEQDVERAAELVVADTYSNPRPVTAEDVRALLRSAL